ncbi:hypothetical protein HK102_013389 [Quaeritorhiza haematococci]|nr:hypothetical protein HK102_013389 [Quaeritorhiza haematococci]
MTPSMDRISSLILVLFSMASLTVIIVVNYKLIKHVSHAKGLWALLKVVFGNDQTRVNKLAESFADVVADKSVPSLVTPTTDFVVGVWGGGGGGDVGPLNANSTTPATATPGSQGFQNGEGSKAAALFRHEMEAQLRHSGDVVPVAYNNPDTATIGTTSGTGPAKSMDAVPGGGKSTTGGGGLDQEKRAIIRKIALLCIAFILLFSPYSFFVFIEILGVVNRTHPAMYILEYVGLLNIILAPGLNSVGGGFLGSENDGKAK